MRYSVLFFSCLVCLSVTQANAETQPLEIILKNNQFTPHELHIPANEKVKITVKNQDNAPAEFESDALSREKVVSAGGEIVLFVGPLKPGAYPYVNDFHRDTTKGAIIAE